MVVPIYKKWEANIVRLQIVRQEKVVQFVAFFQDFTHGDCMNFVLKGTDVFESLSRAGLSCIRIVDAKFALPKANDAENKDFVCLDMPEYPAEHDDIVVSFNSENGKLDKSILNNTSTRTVPLTAAEAERFKRALPASISKMSRMASMNR